MADNTFLAPLSPIQRSTPSQRLAIFTQKEDSIYNKFSPYYQAGGDTGASQPYIYVKLTDPASTKNYTQYDTQALPAKSTIRDVNRMNKFLSSGKGLIFLGMQTLLQNTNPFNETRIYNPLSVSAAAAKPGTLGLTGRPRRYIQVGGGIFSFFASAVLNTVGIQSLTLSDTIEGTATAQLSTQVRIGGGEGNRAGLLRYETSTGANSKFLRKWTGGSSNSNFLSSLIRSITRTIPSTNPRSIFDGTSNSWEFRVEYPKNSGGDGIYHILKADSRKVFDFKAGTRIYNIEDFNRYSAGKIPNNPSNSLGQDNKLGWYASPRLPTEDLYDRSEIGRLYERMVDRTDSFNRDDFAPRGIPRDLREQSQETKKVDGISAIRKALGRIDAEPKKYEEIFYGNSSFSRETKITVNTRGFSKATPLNPRNREIGTADTYNKLGVIDGGRERDSGLPSQLADSRGQSVDLIFLYFYDLVNEKYIPFRAVELSSLSDQNSAEWDNVSYLGRADKLFIYKGFTRDVNFNFKVYANSIEELIPMWERINYLTGLVRPSDYTKLPTTTRTTRDDPEIPETQSTVDPETGVRRIGEVPVNISRVSSQDATGRFIYPPMITFRVGDLFIDQPAVLNSVSVTIPAEANWEMLRKESYEYVYSISKSIIKRGTKSRQLPVMADVAVSMKLLEKELAITAGAHYGYETGNQWPL